MKMLRYIKVRSHSKEPTDLILQINNNPLRRRVPIQQPSHETTRLYLRAFAEPVDWNVAQEKPSVIFQPQVLN
jgi:proteasome activator subunit 4